MLRREASPTHACAWCDRKLDMRPGTVRGVLTTNWGMCPDCLSKRLVALMAAPPRPPFKVDLTGFELEGRLDEVM